VIYVVDWLTFTLLDAKEPFTALKFLGMQDIEYDKWRFDRGHNGYKDGMYYNGIGIFYNGQDNMGVCVSMSGQGCRTYEDILTADWSNWYELFKRLIDVDEINVTRLDIACDEKEGILDINKIIRYTEKGYWIKKLKAWKTTKGSDGSSVQFGQRGGNILIRIYDKAAERGKEGEHWIRCEMQLGKGLAENMLKEILKRDNVGEVYCSVLNNYLRFYEHDDERPTRCTTSPWWANFVQTAEKLRLFQHVGVVYNLSRIEGYLEKQVANSLYTYLAAQSATGMKSLALLLKGKRDRLSKKQTELIQYHKNEGKTHGFPVIEGKVIT